MNDGYYEMGPGYYLNEQAKEIASLNKKIEAIREYLGLEFESCPAKIITVKRNQKKDE